MGLQLNDTTKYKDGVRMTLEETGLTEQEVMNVRDRSLEEAYADHDIGMVHLKARLEAHGFALEDFGDDARYSDEIFYGDGLRGCCLVVCQ